MTGAHDPGRRDACLQAYVEGRIVEEELRSALGGDVADEALRDEVAAYRVVYDVLSEEPELSLSPDFAQRVARAAMPAGSRLLPSPAGLAVALLLLLSGGAAVVVAAIALQLGPPLDASAAVAALVAAWESMRPDLVGAVLSSAAVLAAVDAMVTRFTGQGRGRTTARA